MTRSAQSTAGPTDLRAVSLAGAAAGVAYVAAMEVDLRLVGHNADDLVLLGRPLVGKRRGWARLAGVPVHFVNAVGLALAYAVAAHRRLPGPPWLRGIVFASVENALLYPLTILEDRHPGIRDGQLDRYWTWTAFLQSVPRHVAYGAVLGFVYERLRRP